MKKKNCSHEKSIHQAQLHDQIDFVLPKVTLKVSFLIYFGQMQLTDSLVTFDRFELFHKQLFLSLVKKEFNSIHTNEKNYYFLENRGLNKLKKEFNLFYFLFLMEEMDLKNCLDLKL